MISQGFLLPALEKGEGWNTETSGYSNEGLLLNSSAKISHFPWTWGTKLTLWVYLKQIQAKLTPNTYVQVGYYSRKKKSELFACWNCFRLLLKALAEEKSFLTFFFFLTDKEDVSIQHLHRVTGGIQLDYNILFRWAIKISVATAKQHLLQDIEDIPTYEAVRIALRHNCPEFKAEVFNLLCWEASRCSTSRKEFGYWRKPAFWTVGLHTNLSKKEMATANRQENRHPFCLACLRHRTGDQIMDTAPVSFLKSQWRQ